MLEAFTLPAQNFPNSDHTYVTWSGQPQNLAWGCHGRSSGGTRLCGGSGDFQQASHLGGPNGQAGIWPYGANGVCHQAANRILLPSGKTVSAARGFRASLLIYGTYGRDLTNFLQRHCPHTHPWPELVSCRANYPLPPL